MTSLRGGLFGTRLVYRVPQRYAHWLGGGGDPFLAALLIPAMALGEPLVVDAPVSPSLLANLRRAMDLLVPWNRDNPWIRLHRVPLRATAVSETRAAAGTALFFSGGIDSLFALRTCDTSEVRHLVFVHGFDLPLERVGSRRAVAARLAEVAAATGRELVEVETNHRTLSDPIVSWTMAHGGALAAVGHALGGGARRFLISATDIYATGATWGTHSQLDHLWSSEAVVFESTGAEATRGAKAAALRDFVPARQHLRVCWKHDCGEYNCCRCRKCLRTMLHLHVQGALERFPTFPHPPPVDLLETMVEPPHLWFLWEELAVALRAVGDREVAASIGRMLQRSRRLRDTRRARPSRRPAGVPPHPAGRGPGPMRSRALVWPRRLFWWVLRRDWTRQERRRGR